MTERNSGGRFVSGVDDDDVMGFIHDIDKPFSTTSRVAERFDVDQSTAYRLLQGLADDGRLNKEKVSANAVVWWIPDTGKMEHISRRHGDDYYSDNPEWADDLPDIGEGAWMAYKHGAIVIAPDPYKGGNRPLLVVSNDTRPYYGQDYTLAVMTTTEFDDAVRLDPEDVTAGGMNVYPSFIKP